MARNINQISRNRRCKNLKECILVNYEGKMNQTEEIYFNNYQNRSNPYYIKPINCPVTDPIQMVEAMVTYIKRENIELDDGYKAYCIFDTDASLNKQSRINRAIELAERNNIVPIISTPCFEIWFREHFEYTSRAYNSNEELLEDLRRPGRITNYEKKLNVYPKLVSKTQAAIEHCKRLEREQINNGKTLSSVECNPYTSVYKLVEYLINKE